MGVSGRIYKYILFQVHIRLAGYLPDPVRLRICLIWFVFFPSGGTGFPTLPLYVNSSWIDQATAWSETFSNWLWLRTCQECHGLMEELLPYRIGWWCSAWTIGRDQGARIEIRKDVAPSVVTGVQSSWRRHRWGGGSVHSGEVRDSGAIEEYTLKKTVLNIFVRSRLFHIFGNTLTHFVFPP